MIHVYYHDSHYDYISSITGFVGRTYYCENCDIAFHGREDHSCPKACQGCYDPEPCPFGEPEFCTICLRGFASQQCFAKHRQVKRTKSICNLVRACKTCGEKVIARMSKTHTCPGEKKCKICKKKWSDQGINASFNRLSRQREMPVNLYFSILSVTRVKTGFTYHTTV